jgi:hypothetical protein
VLARIESAVEPDRNAWVFASTRETPLWRDNLLRRQIRPALRKVGLGWVDFKVSFAKNMSLRQGLSFGENSRFAWW